MAPTNCSTQPAFRSPVDDRQNLWLVRRSRKRNPSPEELTRNSTLIRTSQSGVRKRKCCSVVLSARKPRALNPNPASDQRKNLRLTVFDIGENTIMSERKLSSNNYKVEQIRTGVKDKK
jgi:hypothetical protein